MRKLLLISALFLGGCARRYNHHEISEFLLYHEDKKK